MQLLLVGRVRFQLVREDDEYGYLRFQKLHKKRHRWNSTAVQFVLFLIVELSSWKKLRYCCNGSEIGISYQAEYYFHARARLG